MFEVQAQSAKTANILYPQNIPAIRYILNAAQMPTLTSRLTAPTFDHNRKQHFKPEIVFLQS